MKDAKGHGSNSRGAYGAPVVPGYTSKGAQLLQAVMAKSKNPPIVEVPAHGQGVQSVGHPEPPTPVIYKKSGGEVFAAFPTLPGTMNPGTMQSYSHVGQHGSADQSYVSSAKPAKPSEYADLHSELKSIGYNPQPVRKMTQAHFAARKAALK